MDRGEVTRDLILKALIYRPSIGMNELAKEIGMGRTTVSWHLKVLERERQIRRIECPTCRHDAWLVKPDRRIEL